ncbi:MAG: serine/threonine protein kinase [Myxococcota bacterium]|nr:protein kinase [Myxococcota bacterium]
MIGGEGTTYGKYFLIKRLAMGGMGEIFLAKLRGPVGFKKLLVIKRILPHHTANDQFVNMFFAEARIAAQLSHPHIVQIYEMGEIEQSYYLAMEYVAGKPLREVIDRARKLGESVPAAHAATVIADLCSGLSFAHNATGLSGTELSIIHRDVNPANLLISYSGDLKLIDFGIAKSGSSGERTETGTIKGKFVYMSPEQSAAQPLDKRSDIFSVGICLYETLTGSNPFVKSNAVLSMDAIQRLEPPPVSQHSRKLAPFDPIIAKALAKKLSDRYSDCSELADDLHALLRSGDLEQPPTPLAAYMGDIFEDQIASERRIIASALENTQTEYQLSKERGQQRGVPRDRHTRQLTPDEAADVNAASRASSLDPMDTNGSTIARERRNSGRTLAEEAGLMVQSRLPFFVALAMIVVVTVAGSVWITRATIAHRHAVAMEETRRILGLPRADVDVNDPAVRRLIEKAKAAEPMRPRIDEMVIKSGRNAPAVGSPSREKSDKKDAKGTGDTHGKSGSSGLGSVQIVTEPSLKLVRGGRGQSVRVADNGGDFVLGSGGDVAADPFALTVRYAVLDDVMSFTLEPDPWAIVTCNNATSGRSPQTVRAVEGMVTCDLANPKEGRRLHVTLRRTR